MAVTVFGTTAQEALYAVGGFNGWDAKAPLRFESNGGTFTADIDFSSSNEFKMSTVSGEGSEGNGWTEFDSGALKPTGNPTLGQWIEITKNASGNIYAPARSVLTVEVDLAGMRMRFSADTGPAYSGTLPVLHINTAGGKPVASKENYIEASYWLDPLGLSGVEAFGSAEEPLPMQIRGRGNYTWTGFDKKPYRIKLGSKAALAGMTKSKHFVLLAHADDTLGFMRNTLGFAASETMKLAWTPAQRPLEVMLNGNYIGLYFLTENIRVDANRVDVVEQADMATADVDGGWLVEIDNYDSDPHVTVYEGSYPIWFTYKSPEVLSPAQEQFLQHQMQSIQNAIASKDYNAFSSLVDVDMLARYYVVQEVMNDYESFHGSCYLYRQRGASERWMFGPVWDFGSALFRDNDNRFIYDSEYHQVWIGAICEAFPQFAAAVSSVWREFLDNNGPDIVLAAGKDIAHRIASAAVCNYRRWPDYGNADEQASAEKAFSRFNSKIDWLKEQWDSGSGIADICTVAPAVRAYALDGVLYVDADTPCHVTVTGIDGRTARILLHAGINTISSLPRGFYIVAGTKVAL